jgi:hypothetical protein
LRFAGLKCGEAKPNLPLPVLIPVLLLLLLLLILLLLLLLLPLAQLVWPCWSKPVVFWQRILPVT